MKTYVKTISDDNVRDLLKGKSMVVWIAHDKQVIFHHKGKLCKVM